MSIRTTVTLEEDVVARLKQESAARGVSVRSLMNEAIRSGLIALHAKPDGKPYKIKAYSMGLRPGLNLDNIGELIETIEGPAWR